MTAGRFIRVLIAPWIFGNCIRLKVGTVPVLSVPRLREQVVQRFGKETVVHFEVIQHGRKVLDLRDGRLDSGLLTAAGEFGNDDGGQNTKDHQNQEQLDKSKR